MKPLTPLVALLVGIWAENLVLFDKAVLLQTAAPAPFDVKTCPAVPALPFARKAPVKFISPVTSNGYAGVLFPIPALPVVCRVPVIFVFPFTSSLYAGALVPIHTLPFKNTPA